MKVRRQLLFGAMALICIPLAVLAQGGGADIAKRALDSGVAFYRSGEYRQALQDFMTVINGYPDSEWVDEALLHVARYHYEVEGDLEGSRNYLQTIQREYAESNSTPGSYYYLGYILSEKRESVERVRDGLANFERVVRFFPDSDVADSALFQASRLHVFLGEYDAALEKLQKILLEFPDSPLRAEAQFEFGNSFMYMDNILQAMIEFQQVRNLYPDSALAERALNRLTLLYRLYFSMQSSIRPYVRDAGFSFHLPQRMNDPTYLTVGEGDSFYLADKGRNMVYKLDSSGNFLEGISVRKPAMVKISHRGEVTILADRQLKGAVPITLTYATGDAPEPLTALTAFCRGLMGQYYVYDGRRKELFSFKTDRTLEKVFMGQQFRDVRDMAVDRLGYLYVLDGREKRVTKFDSMGRRVKAIGPKFGDAELRDPRFLAVDDANNLYILDRKQKAVYILHPSGNLLAWFSYGDRVQDPRGLAVSSSGAVITIDRKRHVAVRFQ